MEENKITFHGKPAYLKGNFVITDFGEVSIDEVKKDYDNMVNLLEFNKGILIDYDYLYELESILELTRNKDE